MIFVEFFKKFLKKFFNLRGHCPNLVFSANAGRGGGGQVGVGDVAALAVEHCGVFAVDPGTTARCRNSVRNWTSSPIFFAGRHDDPPRINEQLDTGIARAYRWQELLDNGEFDSPEALATALSVNMSCVRRFLRLVLPAPPIVEAIMAGKSPRTLSLAQLDTNLPWVWQEQLKLFGMA